MALEINITPDDVEQLVKDAILKAGLGKAVQDAITKAFSGYDSPVDKEVKAFVSQIVASVIREKYALVITEAVTRVVQERITVELIEKTTATAMDKIVSAAEGRY